MLGCDMLTTVEKSGSIVRFKTDWPWRKRKPFLERLPIFLPTHLPPTELATILSLPRSRVMVSPLVLKRGGVTGIATRE
jgi:hypothetical protein